MGQIIKFNKKKKKGTPREFNVFQIRGILDIYGDGDNVKDWSLYTFTVRNDLNKTVLHKSRRENLANGVFTLV